MKMKETPKVKGRLHIVLKDKNGNIKEERNIKNLIVNSGIAHIVSRMVQGTDAVMSHMALGTSNQSPAPGQTALVSPLTPRRAVTANLSVGQNEIIYTAVFGTGDTVGSLAEAGIFNGSTGGTMLCRTTFSPVNKQTDDTVSINWTISLSVS